MKTLPKKQTRKLWRSTAGSRRDAKSVGLKIDLYQNTRGSSDSTETVQILVKISRVKSVDEKQQTKNNSQQQQQQTASLA